MMPNELAELDLAVARAEGKLNPRIEPETPFSDPTCYIDVIEDDISAAVDWNICRKSRGSDPYCPSTDPVEAMRLQVKHSISLRFRHLDKNYPWQAECEGHIRNCGETPMAAICRAVIALQEKK